MKAGPFVVIGILAGAALVIWGGATLREAATPRTLVLVTLDTFRADRLGRTPTITPKLDALAARGVVFEQCSTVAPLTVPAHATLLTGLLPPRHGLRLNAPAAPLPAKKDRQFATLAELARDNGYATGAFVSASVLRADATGLGAGFDVYDEVPPAAPGALHDAERQGRGEETVDRALAFVKEHGARAFVWVHLFDPHAPYDAPAPWGKGAAHAADAAGYDGEIEYTDHCVGKLLDGLAALGRGDAIVAVIADHGEALGEHGEPTHGYLLHEATLHVPFIVAAPGLSPARHAEPVSAVDVFPTLLGLASLPVPAQVSGIPLFEKASPGEDRAARPVYAETLYGWFGCNWAQTFAIRAGTRKVVRSGPRSLDFALDADPDEAGSRAFDASAERMADGLMAVARTPTLSTPGAAPGPAALAGGSYWTAGGRATAVLPDTENAKLASPYDRMGVLALLDRGRSLLVAGDAAGALRLFDEALAADPTNIQAAWFRGSALEKLRRNAEAADGYVQAFRLGMLSSKALNKALQSWRKAIEAGDAACRQLSIDFLVEARGKGTSQDAATFLFEAYLYADAEQRDAAKVEALLERVGEFPPSDILRQGADDVRRRLAAPPR